MIDKNLNIKKNVILAPLTTFGIGGPADYFCEVKTRKELIKTVKWARVNKLDYFILGGGSNILVADKGIRGLVIRIQNSEFRIQNSKIIAESGVLLSYLIREALKHSLSGLECLAGIPGTIGGAVVGNAGTKKGSISQGIDRVTVLGEQGEIYDLSVKDCQFDYRESRFLKTKEVILEIILKLKKEKSAVIKERIKEVLKSRTNQPKGKSVGCIFKNPRLASAGYLIENAGLKGMKIGEAVVSDKHANWIINLGNASSKDVLKLISLIKEKVKKDFKVNLEEEVKLIGDFND